MGIEPQGFLMIVKYKHSGRKVKGCITPVDGRVMIGADEHQFLQFVSAAAA